MPDTKLILASGSSIKQMLADAGIVFEVITSHVDEDLIKSTFVKETFPERVIELSKADKRSSSYIRCFVVEQIKCVCWVMRTLINL